MTSDIDLLHLHALRIGKEPSKAAPQSHYRDPAETARLPGETKCGSCLYSQRGRDQMFCGKLQEYGKKCEFYRIHKK